MLYYNNMTEPKKKRSGQGNRTNHPTIRPKLPLFLERLSETGNVTASARHAGISRTAVYHWLDRDPEFYNAFVEAERLGLMALEDEARRRGMLGVDEPVVHKGELMHHDEVDPETGETRRVPTTLRRYSDTLLIFMLKGAFPEKYKDRVGVEHSGRMEVGNDLDLSRLADDELIELRRLLDKARTPPTIEHT